MTNTPVHRPSTPRSPRGRFLARLSPLTPHTQTPALPCVVCCTIQRPALDAWFSATSHKKRIKYMEMYISVFFIYCLLLLVLQPPARREHGGVDGHAHVGAVLELEVVEHVGATGGGRVEVRVVLLVREGAPVDAAEGQYVRGVVARASVRERVDVRVEEARVV